MVVDEIKYWKIKSEMLQLRLEEAQLQMAFDNLENRKIKFFTENCLPVGNLRFNDQEFSIEEIKNGK